jgi:hypothetical protein|tara:strand:- start:197 stop:364 length:168 start_codon:yes stop_codon:yes gene_type:complete
MKIEIDVIKDFIYNIDPDSKDDPEFINEVNSWLSLLEQAQVNKNKKNNVNKKRNN